ncbi:hypothetical protein HDV04_005640 [Boothiomyces sp. JEL0838]|nr:hypothetical protein HDV04_005640 [Boothiomyces sp. JEL0838]
MKEHIIKKYKVQKHSQIASICAELWDNECQEIKNYYARETEREYKLYREMYIEVPRLDIDVALKQNTEFRTGFTPTVDKCEPILNYLSHY